MACNDAAKPHIEAQLAELRIQPQGQIEPLPHLPTLVKTADTYLHTRNPFFAVKYTTKHTTNSHTTSQPKKLNTDLNNPPNALEAWDLTQLSFRGSMQRGKHLWALIITPNQQLISVKTGDRIGKNHSIIKHLDKKSITLIEATASDSKWQEKEHIIHLSR